MAETTTKLSMREKAHQCLNEILDTLELSNANGGALDFDGHAYSHGSRVPRTFRVMFVDATDYDECLFCEGRGMVEKGE